MTSEGLAVMNPAAKVAVTARGEVNSKDNKERTILYHKFQYSTTVYSEMLIARPLGFDALHLYCGATSHKAWPGHPADAGGEYRRGYNVDRFICRISGGL